MNTKLRDRLREGAAGRVHPNDCHERIHQDAYTDLMRQDQQIQILERFAAYAEGWLASVGAGPGSLVHPLRVRLRNTYNDLARTREVDEKGCCG